MVENITSSSSGESSGDQPPFDMDVIDVTSPEAVLLQMLLFNRSDSLHVDPIVSRAPAAQLE